MPAVLESLNRCVDSAADSATDGDDLPDSIDTDGDGLDDRFEVLVGWEVTTERGSRIFRSRCSSPDTDNDSLGDGFEMFGTTQRDERGRILFDTNNKPTRATSNLPDPDHPDHELLRTLDQHPSTGVRGDPLTRGAIGDPVTNPTSPDTDLDGLADGFELTPYQVRLRAPTDPSQPLTPMLITSAERLDSDGDTASDYVSTGSAGTPASPTPRTSGTSTAMA
ncbi:MAG: hypothetical protein M3179_13360 [Actinomycetota bacterium]|nr:hypothetical protein [Actinomycetota bacterium]